MLRALSLEEVAVVSGGMMEDSDEFDDGSGGGGGDDGGFGDAGYGVESGGEGDGADQGAGATTIQLNPDGSIPVYTDPQTGDIVVTAPYNNADMLEATIAYDGIVVAGGLLGVTAETKFLQMLGVGGSIEAGLHPDEIKAAIATAQRNSKNQYGQQLYNRFYNQP